MAWYKSLSIESIDSWRELCRQFTAHFTASRKHPKTEATLEAISQRKKNEPPREYIDRFNKVAVEVKTDDRMKLYVLD
jgi:hypothetical protein